MTRRLIETDEMPIGAVSEHSRRDQNVKKGHLHTLHVWWATRPLAACRAVLLATLLPDPADEDCPEAFRQEAREALKAFTGRDLSDPLALRRELLKFIGQGGGYPGRDAGAGTSRMRPGPQPGQSVGGPKPTDGNAVGQPLPG